MGFQPPVDLILQSFDLFCFSNNRGTEEYFGLDGRITIINSTLGKALGGAAGEIQTAMLNFL